MLLERQGEPVDAQTWLCKEELGYGGLHVLLYCAALFGKLLGYYLQVQSPYFKKCFGKWRMSERAYSNAKCFMMREFELSLTSPERQMKDSLTIQVYLRSPGLSLAGSPNSKSINAVIMAITGNFSKATVMLVDV